MVFSYGEHPKLALNQAPVMTLTASFVTSYFFVISPYKSFIFFLARVISWAQGSMIQMDRAN